MVLKRIPGVAHLLCSLLTGCYTSGLEDGLFLRVKNHFHGSWPEGSHDGTAAVVEFCVDLMEMGRLMLDRGTVLNS